MFVVENDYVIEAFAADASDDSLRIRILPRASWSRPHFPNTHSLNSVLDVFRIDSILIRHRAIWFVIEMESMGNTYNKEFREWVFGKCRRLHEARGKILMRSESSEASAANVSIT